MSVETAKIAELRRIQASSYAFAEDETPASDADIFADITADTEVTVLQISATLAGAAVLSLVRKGTNTTTAAFNGGYPLEANQEYTFTTSIRRSVPVNFQLGASVRIDSLLVVQISGGVV